ncbi:Decapping nuclease DXO-like protein, chloroplastic [Armadillidium nasatum]|uniref:Decapping nuclease n=1 Tax=Armadillidium nasatum TaxID=96803 RepID=A0A5N5TCW4_9CRUS|nr:Decapping nuclease DXO-like protein, chloroplastic [Armadillidium nasatum]
MVPMVWILDHTLRERRFIEDTANMYRGRGRSKTSSASSRGGNRGRQGGDMRSFRVSAELDLNTAKEEEKPYTGTLLKTSENFFSWILSNMDDLTEIFSCETKFVFLKNVFTKFLNGIVYLLNHKEEENYALEPQISRWGHKFQQFLTYGENVKEGVVCNRDYRCVMNGKLGSHNLLFSASMDCFNQDICDFESLDPSSSILLKCSFDNQKKNSLERFKMYDWCVSLAAANIPHILVGFRTVDGIVNLLKLYTEDDLRNHGKAFWDINAGFTFVENVLSFIEKTTKTKPGTVFSFTKSSYTSHIKVEETNMENFPPKWFTEELEESGILEHGSHN